MTDALEELSILTGDLDLLPVRQIDVQTIAGESVTIAGRYYLYEEDLPVALQALLHGRAFVIDRESITTLSSANPVTYYLSADIVQGIIIPARSVSINAENGDIYYRWTDDGEKFTAWITLPDGAIDSYLQQEETRFAEIQAYTNVSGTLLSIRATR